MKKQLYFDYAAATPLDPRVLESMEPYLKGEFYNPSANYLAARVVRRALEEARERVAHLLGAKPAEIIFTAGATEANNLAIQGVLRKFPDSKLLVGAIEHESVLAPAQLFANRVVSVGKDGRVDLAKLEKMLDDKVVLVSLGWVNNEIGTIQPIAEVTKILNKLSISRRESKNSLPIYLHTDATQAGNFLDLHVSRLGVDLLSLNGGKIYGSKQSGILYVEAGTQITPLILGGGQEFNLRSGTENVAAAVGLAKALEIAQTDRQQESERINRLRTLFVAEISQALPAAVINESSKHHAPHIVSLTVPGVDNERLMMELDEAGVIVATGSACSAASSKPSQTLAAIGLDDNIARSTIRVSFGRGTTETSVHKLTALLHQLAPVSK